MKAFLVKSFTHRSVFDYLLFASGILILIADIVYLPNTITLAGKSYYQLVSFILFLVGSLSALASFFFPEGKAKEIIGKQLPALSAICYGFGLGMIAYQTSFPLADILTKVYFFGGNATLGIIFFAIFLVGSILDVVACFQKDKRKDN